MYKKRFAKWGFRKSSGRVSTAAPPTRSECARATRRKPGTPEELNPIPACPGFGHHERPILCVLTSVRIWSQSFFESVQSRNTAPATLLLRPPMPPQSCEKAQNVSFAFKMVTDLLDQGRGDLAGRMARKAFLLVEGILTLEGPALVWNLLEMMHNMLLVRHAQLFQMLLSHLLALVDHRMPKAHPLPSMLLGLRGFLSSFEYGKPLSGASSPSSFSSASPRSSVAGGSTPSTATDPWLLTHLLPSLLERAWILNAGILFDHFDLRHFPLYCHVYWQSCSIEPPVSVFGTADRWFGSMQMQQISSTTAKPHRTDTLSWIVNPEEDMMLRQQLTPPTDVSRPQDYKMLRASSIAALQKHGNSILSGSAEFGSRPTALLRILAVLASARALGEMPTVASLSQTATDQEINEVSRIHARHVACAIRTLVDLNTERDSDSLRTASDLVEQARSMVTLHDYAYGKTAPQTVQELWLLERALMAAGEHGEAREVGRTAFSRLETYIEDIPAHSV